MVAVALSLVLALSLAAAVPQSETVTLAAEVGTKQDGTSNLLGSPLKPCGSGLGWTSSGSCDWDPADSGVRDRSRSSNL